MDAVSHRKRAAGALVVTDTVALLAFVVVGVLDHGGTLGVGPLVRNAVPILGAWLGAAAVLGTYREGGLGRLAATWAAAVPAGVALRGLWLGRDFGTGFLVFTGVALSFTLLFLVAGRLVLLGLARGRRAVLR
ncbi:MAG TPA: DUF3054 domain-containing protein [Actinomycetota bacterium]|nr:DUF3054 domain-containing protein [Actinomycetota bacterium]